MRLTLRMHEMSLTDRTLAALAAADLASEEVDLPLRARRREAIGRLLLVVGDIAAVVLSLVVVATLSQAAYTWWLAALIPFYVLLTKCAGLYDRDQFVLHKTTLDETPALVAVGAIFVLLTEAVQGLEFTGRSHPLALWAGLTVSLVAFRTVARKVAIRSAAPERLLVVGDATAAMLVRRKLAADPRLAATVVGRISVESEIAEPPDRLLGTVEELPAVIEEHRVERIVVAPTFEGGEDVADIIRLATACGVRVAVLPRLLEVIGTSVEFDDLGGQVMLGMRGFGLSPSSRVLKRVFDLVVGIGLVIALAPLMLLIAIAVKLSSRGPVLFRQTRVGRHGNEFKLLKFRTMGSDAEQRKHELLELNEAAPMFKIADDPRTTRIGRFLRRRSLDELPQLFNVLRGDMSLVGPRPLITEEDRLFSGWQRRRYHVAPGMTGPWQILGSSRVPMSDMVTIDYLYCANWSLWLDAKVLARTIPYVLSRRSPENTA
jgi:exopolysaccharide biosynthesis polyprenyl glycosylphosphotransferase